MNIRTIKTFVCVLFFCAFPALAQQQFYFTTNNDNTLTLVDFYIGDPYNSTPYTMVIPSTYNGLPVTSIGAHAFDYSIHIHPMYMTGVSFPNTITNIQPYAFAYCNLNGVAVPGSVLNIADHAFFDNYHLSSVTISNGVRALGAQAFAECGMSGVSIPASVTNIGGGQFSSCRNLASISVDTNNPAYASVSGVLFDVNQTTLITYPSARAGSNYIIPGSVNIVGDDAFMGCNLSSVVIPTNVTTIGTFAFYNNLLTNVFIPASVTNLGAAPFGGGVQLTAINVDGNNPACTSVNGVLFDKAQTMLIQYPLGRAGAAYTIPSTVVSIGVYAFAGESALTALTIPASVSLLGADAFVDSFTLKNIYAFGNAPVAQSPAFADVSGTVYYLPGTIGWNALLGGNLSFVPWLLPTPTILTGPPSFGVQANHFGFLISWATNASVIVKASTSLANPAWQPIATNALTNGTFYFTDPQWANYPGRFYRVQKQ